jgi:phage-related protein
MANQKEKPLAWLGSSKKDLMTLPVGVRKFFGHVLREKGDEKKGTDLFHRLKPPPLVVVT